LSIKNKTFIEFGVEDFSSFAAWSYEIADAMMEARDVED
jgi:hypothetical protein